MYLSKLWGGDIMNSNNLNLDEKIYEIVEMEILSSIDKYMHVLLLRYYDNLSKGCNIFSRCAIDDLKQRIPDYIEKQFKVIISENLSETVRMIPPISE